MRERALTGSFVATSALACIACFPRFEKVSGRVTSSGTGATGGAGGGSAGVFRAGAAGAAPASGGEEFGGVGDQDGTIAGAGRGGSSAGGQSGAGGGPQPPPVGGTAGSAGGDEAGSTAICNSSEERCCDPGCDGDTCDCGQNDRRMIMRCNPRGPGWELTMECDHACVAQDGRAQCVNIVRVCPVDARNCERPSLAQVEDTTLPFRDRLVLAFQAERTRDSVTSVWRYVHATKTSHYVHTGTDPTLTDTGEYLAFVDEDKVFAVQGPDWTNPQLVGGTDLADFECSPPTTARTGRVAFVADPPANTSQIRWADPGWETTYELPDLPRAYGSSPALSPDGTSVAFTLRAGDAASQDVCVHRLNVTGSSTCLSGLTTFPLGTNDNPTLATSDDGILMAFDHESNGRRLVYLTRLRQPGVSLDVPTPLAVQAGELPPEPQANPTLSSDGRTLAFESGGNDGDTSIFACGLDLETSPPVATQCQRVSVRWDGAAAAGDSMSPSLSADGAYVAFDSRAALTPDATSSGSVYLVKLPTPAAGGR